MINSFSVFIYCKTARFYGKKDIPVCIFFCNIKDFSTLKLLQSVTTTYFFIIFNHRDLYFVGKRLGNGCNQCWGM